MAAAVGSAARGARGARVRDKEEEEEDEDEEEEEEDDMMMARGAHNDKID